MFWEGASDAPVLLPGWVWCFCVSGVQTVQCHCLQSSSNGPAPAYKVKNISCFQECAVEEACISRGFGGAEPWIIP